MIPLERQIVLDTGILLHLVRGKERGRQILQQFQLRNRRLTPTISIVTIGEMLAFSRTWGHPKQRTFDELRRSLLIVDISRPAVLDGFAEAETLTQGRGRTIGQNDLWIAATTRALDATLITTDKDFDALHPHFIEREYVAP